jgi:anti-anti-sigma factor
MGKHTLDISDEQVGNTTVITLSGPVDSATFDRFKSVLVRACASRSQTILLDCADLTYMNSRAFGVLSQQQRSLLAGSGKLALCSLDRRMVRTIDLLGLGQTLTIYESKEEALAALG